MNRREFFGVAGCGLAAAGCASLVTHAVTPIAGAVRLRPTEFPEITKTGASLRIQPVGHPEPIYLLRVDEADGQVVFNAVSPICTHRGCTVETQATVLVCPCHGSTFSRSGTVLRGPAERPLRSYQTARLPDGSIEIRLGAGA
jgi:cytochrome b6-f complex iron-sulfur subunit